MPKRKAASITKESASSSSSSSSSGKNAPAEKKARASSGGRAGWSWAIDNDLLVYTPNEKPAGSAKVIAFDFDSTLCQPQEGRTFPRSWDDIEWFHASVPNVLKKKHEEGYAIVVMSNQGGLLSKKGSGLSVDQWKKRVEWFTSRVDFPLYFYGACGKPSPNRKPNVGMWEWYSAQHNDDIAIDKEASFYVGDAAGRVKDWEAGKKKDFSAGDRMFAANIGLNFQTPEEFFFNAPPTSKWNWGVPDPSAIVANGPKAISDTDSPMTVKTQEMILMMGYPASGKSTFVRRYLDGYERVNMDTLKKKEKCWKAAEAAVKEGKSVVIDNTNPNKETRKPFIDIAKAAGIPVRLFQMQTTKEHAIHNNLTRGQYDGDTISSIAFNMFKGKSDVPQLSEGLSEIKKINFVPQFDNDQHKSIYMRFQHA